MQKKYLEQIEELYDEFNVVKMPLLVEEVRGKERLEMYVARVPCRFSRLTQCFNRFSEMLIKPYQPPE